LERAAGLLAGWDAAAVTAGKSIQKRHLNAQYLSAFEAREPLPRFAPSQKRWPQRWCLRGSVGAKRLSYEQPNANAFCGRRLFGSRPRRDHSLNCPPRIEPRAPFLALTLCLPLHPSIPPRGRRPWTWPAQCGPFSLGRDRTFRPRASTKGVLPRGNPIVYLSIVPAGEAFLSTHLGPAPQGLLSFRARLRR